MSKQRAARSERRRQVWITTVQASQILGIDGATFDQLTYEADIKPTRIGLMSYVNYRDLYPLIQEQSEIQQQSG
jgi:hypothetical protein